MERSKKILQKIAFASQRVVAAANEYADRKDLFNVERAHIQLEEEMQKVTVSCDCLASIVPTSLLTSGPSFDERIRDWVTSDEPRVCYEMLERMAKLLEEDTYTRTPTSLTGRATTATKDKIEEAVHLFETHKPYFHFLFTSEIWNNERVRQQERTSYTVTRNIVNGQGLLEPDEAKKKEGERTLDEILKWLDGLNCAEKQDVTLSLRQADTCKWLFDTTQYKMWRDRGLFLWLRGKAGAGKSVLASSVINSLEGSSLDGVFLAYFYCDFRNERSTRAAEAMRSILFQLLRQVRRNRFAPRGYIDGLIEAKERGGATLSDAKQLAGFVSRVAEQLAQKPLVIVDALDECKDVGDLLQALAVLKDRVRLFVTSRPLHGIVDNFSGLPFVSMEDMADKLSADIELHVTRELDARQRLRDLDTQFKAEIRSFLCEKADGMFRWVQCSIDTLNRCVTRKEVRSTLNSLPKGLDETYERILLAIDMNTREGQLAQRALVWLVAALRPLRLDELMEGLSINLRTRTLNRDLQPMHDGALLDACGSLVTYIERTGIIILSHFSVKVKSDARVMYVQRPEHRIQEYLMGEIARIELSRYHVDWELAHLHLARSCMCYVSICLQYPRTFDCSSSPHSMFQPLRDYVTDHALGHLNHLGSKVESLLHDVSVLQRDIESRSTAWDNICLSAGRVMDRTNPCWPTARHDLLIYILIAFCPNSLLRVFLRQTRLTPKEGTNPLVYAAYFNKHDHAVTLLSHGARLNQAGWVPNRFCRKLPLEVALATTGSHDVATLFVREGSPVSLEVFGNAFDGRFPMLSPSVMMALLQTDSFTEVVNDPMTLVLSSPVAFGHLLRMANEKVKLALIRRIIQASAEPCQDTLLRIAVEQGHPAIVHYLLSLDVTLPSNPLMSLTSWDAEDSDLEDSDYEPDTLEMAKILVAHGCDLLQADSCGKTPLHIAIHQGYVSVVRYLLSLGASLPSDLSDTYLWNLELNSEVICLLAEHGGNALAHKGVGSLLHIALERLSEDDSLETLKFLVAHGCDLLGANLNGKTPMHIAVERGHTSVAHHLFSLGVPLPSTIPNTSVFRHQPEMTFPIVEHGGDTLAHDMDGGSLLHVALERLPEHKSLETAEFLIARGCDPFQANSRGQPAIHIAIQRGHVSVARYLLSLGVNLPFDWLNTFFWSLEYDLKPEMICFLVEHGMDARSRTVDGDTLLHIVLASRLTSDHLETAKYLITHGCDPFQANSLGETPLHISLDRGHVSVTRYLLSLGVPLPSNLFDILWKSVHWPETIYSLVELGGNIPARAKNGGSLLHITLEQLSKHNNNSLKIAEFLVAHGCDPFEANSCGKTPLHLAVERGHVSVARYLLSLGASLPSDLLDLLRFRYPPEMICLLAEHGGNTLTRTQGGDSLLHIALPPQSSWNYNPLETVKFLIAHGCDPFQANSHGKTPLHVAIELGHVSVGRYMLSLGAALSSDLLDLSTISYDGEAVSWIVENGIHLNAIITGQNSMLHTAMRKIQSEDEVLEATRFLLAHGSDPYHADFQGVTPIHIAIQQRHVSVIRFLLSLGIPLPEDALFIALRDLQPQVFRRYPSSGRGRLEIIIPFLVDQGANVHARRSGGDTVLHAVVEAAAICNHSTSAWLLKFFVACGCDPSVANADGVTPLHVAVKLEDAELVKQLLSLDAPLPPDILFTAISNNYIVFYDDPRMTIVEVLVAAGCDILACNEAGHTPIYDAVTRGHVAVVDYLLSLMDGPPLEDLVSAVALTPLDARDEMASLLNSCRATREAGEF